MPRMMCSNNLLHPVRGKDQTECETCGAEIAEMTEEHKFLFGAFQRALKEAPRPQGVKGAIRVRIKLCSACGAPIWRGTDPIGGKSSEVVLDDGGDDPRQGPPLCRDCEAIRFRYPELYYWVSNTAFWRRSRMGVMRTFTRMSGGGRSLEDVPPPPPFPAHDGERVTPPGPPYPPPGPDTSRKRKKVKAGAKKKAAKRGR